MLTRHSGTANALVNGGPLGLFLAYCVRTNRLCDFVMISHVLQIVGSLCYSVMISLGGQ